MNLSATQTRLLIISNISCWIVILFFLLTSASSDEKAHFEEITAERINIVNEDGTTVIAISNKERIAPPVINGKEYSVEVSEGRKYMAGMIFFNEEGDEMGGLVFNSFKMPNGRVAGIGHLSFDRFKDNQVLSLEYNENRRGIKSGITLYDRPGDGIFAKNLDLLEEAYTDSITTARLNEIKDSLQWLSRENKLGAERVFLGNKNQIPQLTLNDDAGNIRVKLYVDTLNEAKLQFFDDQGTLITEFPESKNQ